MRRKSWTAIIIGGAVITTATGALAGWRLARHAAALPHASCGGAVTHSLDGSTRALGADPDALACFTAAARTYRASRHRDHRDGHRYRHHLRLPHLDPAGRRAR